MFVNRRFLAPWLVAGGLSVLSLLFAGASACAGVPHYSDIMPVSQIKNGMMGYGLTTFHGTTISRFDVTVIGVLKQANFGHDLILIRMKGGPITERGANLIHGMSGSPIYINGKIIGAFSQGEAWPKEPVGMVTPIEDMLEAWDPNIPQKPSYYQPAVKPGEKISAAQRSESTRLAANPFTPATGPRERVIALPQPIHVGDRRISQLVLCNYNDDTRPSTANIAVMHRATGLLYLPGGKESNRVWMQKLLDQKGYALTVVTDGGGSGAGEFKGAPLKPGSCFGTMLATGDIPFGGYGTVTYRRGDRMLGFGHPLMGLGAMEGAITSAYVVDVFSGLQTSHLIPIAGPVIGTLRQDRDFSVSGEIGSMPHLIPFEITINDATTHRSQTFHDRLLQHPDLTPNLLALVANEAIQRVHDIPGDAMARVTTTVDAAEVGVITRNNLVFDAKSISDAALQDLTDITGVVSGNPFYPLPIHSVKMTVDISGGHNTATLERIFLKQGRFEPGDNLEVGMVIKPYRQDPIVRTINIKIPADTPTGRYQLVVHGGMAGMIRLGGMLLGGGGDPQTPPVNVHQMVAQLNQKESNTDLVARLVLNSYAPAVEGERLSQMPPNLSALMRSERNSGVRMEREEIRVKEKAGYVITGSQQLLVTVVRKNTQEAPSSGGGIIPTNPGGSSPSPLTLPGSTGISSASLEDEGSVAREAGGEPMALLSTDPQAARWLAALGLPSPDDKKADTKTADGKDPKSAPAKDTKKDDKTTATATVTPSVTLSDPPKPETSNEKPVGRQPVIWRQSARTDFAAGKFTGTGVTASGELRLSPTLRRLSTSTETYVWALVSDAQGNLYAGTGTAGRILKIDPQGKTTVFATLPVVAVQSLLVARDGSLWAGTGMKGALYHLTPDGNATLVRTLSENYVLALAQDSRGNLYIGAGGSGTVYRLTVDEQGVPKGDAPPPAYFKTSAEHIMALATDAKDNLYVGSAPEGIVYKVKPDGKGSVLFDAKENAIMAIAVTPEGDLYAATGPKALLYRVAANGAATTLFDKALSFYTALKVAPDGTVYAATPTEVYRIQSSPSRDSSRTVVLPLDNPKDVDFLCMTLLPGGDLAVGTGNVGEVYTAPHGPRDSASRTGSFDSVVRDARLQARWGMVRWEATLPTGSQLTVSTRTGDVAEPDSTWSDWKPIHPTGQSEGAITSPPARYIQYRLELSGGADSNAQPAIREVMLDYMPRNQAPKVAFVTPLGGERWAKSQTVRWAGSDPDNDTLSYELFYSTDMGTTWKPVPAGKSTGVEGGGTAKLPSMEEFEKSLDPSMPPFFKQMALDRHRKLLEQGNGGANTLRETYRSWDTSGLPDGTYWLKVVASDQPSNPTDALTAEAISEPFLICNTPPQVQWSGSPVINADKTVAIQGSVMQKLVAVTAVQYRVDGGEWVAAIPKDGLFDTEKANFGFVTMSLPSGKHTIEVLAFNAAGNKATDKIEVMVP